MLDQIHYRRQELAFRTQYAELKERVLARYRDRESQHREWADIVRECSD